MCSVSVVTVVFIHTMEDDQRLNTLVHEGDVLRQFGLPLARSLKIAVVRSYWTLSLFVPRSPQKSIGIPIGKMWLSYGCRHPYKDFIYKYEFTVRFNYSVAVVFNRDELKLHLSSGVLTHLNVSFSRLRKDEVVRL